MADRCRDCHWQVVETYDTNGILHESPHILVSRCEQHEAEDRWLHPQVVIGEDGIAYVDEGIKPQMQVS